MYSAISKSALRAELVLHCHFSDNEKEESLGKQLQRKKLGHGVNLPQEEVFENGFSYIIQGHILKKTIIKQPLQNMAFLDSDIAICNLNLKNV